MKKIRKLINLIFVVIMTSGISYCTYNFLNAENRVKELCTQIKQGMTLEELKSFSNQNGLSPSMDIESGIIHLCRKKNIRKIWLQNFDEK